MISDAVNPCDDTHGARVASGPARHDVGALCGRAHRPALKSERGLVRSVVAGKGFQPGITLSEHELAAIQAPALMVYGSDDPLGSEKLWRDFMASLPNGSLRLIADSGHLPWYDHPHDVGALTRTHLQTPPTRSA